MTAIPLQRKERSPLVDALRAFALFGILQVNVQTFVWGPGDPIGFLSPTADWPDATAYLLVATLVSTKFMALFAFLFGYGFTLQMKLLRRNFDAQGATDTAITSSKRIYRRRLWFLLAMGLAHGCLLYFGDVLAMYALCGFILLNYANVRPAALLRSMRLWGVGFAVPHIVFFGVAGLLHQMAPQPDTNHSHADELLSSHDTYMIGNYGDQILVRVPDFLGGLITGIPQYVPLVMTLFLLGALAARQGWLRYPERHPRVWRMASRIGALGLILACTGAALGYTTRATAPAQIDYLGILLRIGGLTTMALYVAWIVRHQNTVRVRRFIFWLAPAGRMPLSNYLLQSVLMGALLSGWGLGWGATLTRADLAGLGIAIVLAQILLSRLWIAHFDSGPMEALWRRATYSRQ